jgi:PAS domain S-box-containing protein
MEQTSDHEADEHQSMSHMVRHEAVLEGMSAGLFGYRKSKTGFSIVCTSGAFAEVTGCVGTEVLGKRLDFFFGSRTDPEVVRSINRAVSLGQPFRGDFLFCRKDGGAIWCLLVLVPTDTADQPPSFFSGALMDITAQKTQEDQLKAYQGIFENAVEGIYQSTPDGSYLKVNPSLARMYGYKKPEELLAQVRDIQYEIYVDPAMREKFKKEIEKADMVHGLEYQVRRRDGQIIWVSENARAVRDAQGRMRYYEGFIEDITARKQAEAALRTSQEKLIETSRQVGMAEVATGVLHNMGNALNSINVSTTLIANKVRTSKVNGLVKVVALMEANAGDVGKFITNDPKGQQLPKYLAILAERLMQEQAELGDEVNRLGKTLEHVNAILAMQQNFAKGSSLAEEVDLIELVEDALRVCTSSLERHKVQVDRHFVPGLPKVMVPKHQVLQILINLIGNAKNACDNANSDVKRLTLRVGLRHDGRFMRVEVVDNGVGIPKENLTRIFNHGFTTRQDGHGFGLHSGAVIAKQLGGSLTALSEGLGKGASFVLELPLRPCT